MKSTLRRQPHSSVPSARSRLVKRLQAAIPKQSGNGRRGALIEFEASGSRQLCLPLIKRPESLRLQFKRACHVQGVQSPRSQACGVAPGQLCAKLEGLFWQSDLYPNSILTVFLELSVDLASFAARQELLKDLLFDGMRPFGAVTRCKPRARLGGHSPDGLS